MILDSAPHHIPDALERYFCNCLNILQRRLPSRGSGAFVGNAYELHIVLVWFAKGVSKHSGSRSRADAYREYSLGCSAKRAACKGEKLPSFG